MTKGHRNRTQDWRAYLEGYVRTFGNKSDIIERRTAKRRARSEQLEVRGYQAVRMLINHTGAPAKGKSEAK